MMKTYNILGSTVKISTEFENYMEFERQMIPLLENAEKEYNSWYEARSDCKSVYRNSADIISDILIPVADMGVSILNKNGVYNIDRRMLMNDYLIDCLDEYFEALDQMMDKLDQITQTQNREKEYRRMRKASRGRMVGGGFGLSGALKGMAEAGMINATTGMAHSMFNMVGNMGSAISASSSKSSLYSNSKKPLCNAICSGVAEGILQIGEVIENNTNVKFEHVTQRNADRAKAILNNYKNGRIPDNEKMRQITSALEIYPYYFDIYVVIWEDFADKTGDLRKMAEKFGVPLEEYIKKSTEEYCGRIFKKYCATYINSKNPVLESVRERKQLLIALVEMLKYCEERKVSTQVSIINKCKEILKKADIRIKTVDGITYDSADESEKIRVDQKKFYDYLNGKDICLLEVRQKVAQLDYSSIYFREHIQEIINKEIGLRNPLKLFENIKEVVCKYFPEQRTKLGVIEVGRVDQSLKDKEGMIRSITSMPENEEIILLVNYSSNGKSGIVLTNYYFREYSRGFFGSNSNGIAVKNIQNIVCCGENQYLAEGNETFNFKIKSGLDIETQNVLGDFLQECIRMVNNLLDRDRNNIKYFKKEIIRCECGVNYDPSCLEWCPQCHKKYMKEKGFVQTVLCNNCGNRVVIGSKFCTKCGNEIIQTKKCHNCGYILKKVDRFCAKCGTEQKKEFVQDQRCYNCGSQLKQGAKFCTTCGKEIKNIRMKI